MKNKLKRLRARLKGIQAHERHMKTSESSQNMERQLSTIQEGFREHDLQKKTRRHQTRGRRLKPSMKGYEIQEEFRRVRVHH